MHVTFVDGPLKREIDLRGMLFLKKKVKLDYWYRVVRYKIALIPSYDRINNRYIWFRGYYELLDIKDDIGLHNGWSWYSVVKTDDFNTLVNILSFKYKKSKFEVYL